MVVGDSTGVLTCFGVKKGDAAVGPPLASISACESTLCNVYGFVIIGTTTKGSVGLRVCCHMQVGMPMYCASVFAPED